MRLPLFLEYFYNEKVKAFNHSPISWQAMEFRSRTKKQLDSLGPIFNVRNVKCSKAWIKESRRDYKGSFLKAAQ